MADAHWVSISVYCDQLCTSRNVPTRSNSSTATNSVNGAQSSGASTVGTSRSIVLT